jgi:CDGSH-type Zn-finger protein
VGSQYLPTEKENAKRALDDKMKVKVSKNGPYLVSGRIPLLEQIIGIGSDGNPVEWRTGKNYPLQKNCALCRCGQSDRKPFCDGTHLKIGFDAMALRQRIENLI